MRRFPLIPLPLIALALLLAGSTTVAQTPTAEDSAGVQAALQHYLNGHATGDSAEFRKAFHPDARMTFVRDGKIVHRQELQLDAQKDSLIDAFYN
jgi:hypothetical protein